jgi:hypothetical protein
MVLLWDGLPAHRSWCMSNLISYQRLPRYASLLQQSKSSEISSPSERANLCRDTIAVVLAIAETAWTASAPVPKLCFGFLRHTGLKLGCSTAGNHAILL